MFDASDREQSRRAVDRSVGDKPRLPVPMHVLRLGLRHRGQGHEVRVRSPARRAEMVRRQGDQVHLRLRCEFRDPEARRGDRPGGRRDARPHRLSARVLGAEHQERDRARLSDAEDPGRRQAQQGRRAVDAEPRSDDAEEHQARQHLAGDLFRAGAALHRRQGRDLQRSHSRAAGRDLRVVPQRRRQADPPRSAQSHPVQQSDHPAQCRDGQSRISQEVRDGHGAVRDHQHPRHARGAGRRRSRDPGFGDRHLFAAAGGLAAHARVRLDGGVPALRQAAAIADDGGLRDRRAVLLRHHRGRSWALPRNTR